MKLRPNKWDELQHYKDRRPYWIKLHTSLLNNFSYSSVSIGTKATLPLLWILACEYEDGVIDASLEEISFRIHIDKKTVSRAIDELIEIGMFTVDTVLYQSVPIDSLEKEKEKEKEHGVFEKIWKKYQQHLKSLGRRGGNKQKALANYMKLRKKYTDDDIVGLVSTFYGVTVGAKNLENILKEIEMKDYLGRIQDGT